MFGPQNADAMEGGHTAKTRATQGKGKPFADGARHMQGFNPSTTASPGHTAPLKRADSAGKIDVPADVREPSYRDSVRADVGTHKVSSNIPHSEGSATRYAKGDEASHSDEMPDWHRTRSRGASPRGG